MMVSACVRLWRWRRGGGRVMVVVVMLHGAHVELRGQLRGADALLPCLPGFQELNLGFKAVRQVPLPAGLSLP